jgi:hypothetical protein
MIVDSPLPEIALQTDDAGRFSFMLPFGEFTLEAHGPNGTAGRTSIVIAGPETEVKIELH